MKLLLCLSIILFLVYIYISWNGKYDLSSWIHLFSQYKEQKATIISKSPERAESPTFTYRKHQQVTTKESPIPKNIKIVNTKSQSKIDFAYTPVWISIDSPTATNRFSKRSNQEFHSSEEDLTNLYTYNDEYTGFSYEPVEIENTESRTSGYSFKKPVIIPEIPKIEEKAERTEKSSRGRGDRGRGRGSNRGKGNYKGRGNNNSSNQDSRKDSGRGRGKQNNYNNYNKGNI